MNDIYLEYIPDRYGLFRKEYPNLSFCRVTLQEKGLYQVISSEGAHQARVSGKFQYDAKTVSDYPAVGDYVMADLNDTDTAIIHDDMEKIYEKLKHADTVVIASPVYFYGISAQLKMLIDRLHTPMRNRFPIKRLGLILVGAATLPDLFDSIIMQYRMICRFFNLEDIGTVLVSGAKEKGDVSHGDGLERAYELGQKLGLK